jgi:branched-chain amino acid transport system substrate-binding protein
VHWTYDTWAFGHGTARGVLAQGGKSWFFVTADYAFGQDLEKQAGDEVNSSGGKVLGSVRHPIATNDFSSFLLQAQASQADVVALANAGGDTVNAIKQAADFNLGRKQKIVALILTCRPCLPSACRQRRVCRRSMPGIGTSTIRRAPGRSATRSAILRR